MIEVVKAEIELDWDHYHGEDVSVPWSLMWRHFQKSDDFVSPHSGRCGQMGKLEPGNEPMPDRDKPSCCARCESRSIVNHCKDNVYCKWMKCKKCGATNGLVSHHRNGLFIGYKRHWFDGHGGQRVILEADGA